MRFIIPGHINRNLTIFIIILTFTGCKLLDSSIINNCSSDIKIDICYYKDLMPYIPGDTNQFYKFIDKTTENNRAKRISFDSLNFIASYKINPADTFYIKPAMKIGKDTIYIINELLFIKNLDTLFLDDYSLYEFVFFNDSDIFNS